MKRIIAAILIAALATVTATAAQARHHHSHHHMARIALAEPIGCVFDNNGHVTCQEAQKRYNPVYRAIDRYEPPRVVGYRPAGCPHAWCGCGTSLRVFGRIIPELNLAANWRRFPSASPAAGMVAWRYGHVFYIESVNSDGSVIAYDPNSGNHVAHIHTVSLRGFRVVNPHAERMAMR